jgi:hypothetical protein
MATRNKVVVSGSTVTVGQIQDQFRKIGDGTIGFAEMQNFLDNPRKFSQNQTTIVRAINILGADKVITKDQWAEAWRLSVPRYDTLIHYSEDVLRNCADSNKNHSTDFRLIYLHGYSLRGLQTEISMIQNQPLCSNNNWWLHPDEDHWTLKKPDAKYYLIDFSGVLPSISWDDQEKEIAKLGSYERAHEASVSEAIITIFMISGERLLENWSHWGPSLVKKRFRSCVGRFDEKGLQVDRYHPVGNYDDLHVCLLRKFDS